MPRSLRGFALALACVWAVLIIAAWLYSQDQNIPGWIVAAVVPAFLIEAALYLAAGTESTRLRLERLPPPALAAILTAAGPLPYAIYSIGTGLWTWSSFAALVAIAALVAFWYVLLPARPAVDFLLLALLAAIVISKVFTRIYPAPMPRIEVQVLGFTMLARTGIVAVLSLRRLEGIGFGFLPRRRDWLIGLTSYALFLPVGIALAVATGFVSPDLRPFSGRVVLLAIGTFLSFLWVVGLAEEFFFRGMLQQLLGRAVKSEKAGWIIASIIFGAAHLPFRDFPNYRFALIAAVAGAFYGWAYMRARSIRAAMVAHALTVTTWRVLGG